MGDLSLNFALKLHKAPNQTFELLGLALRVDDLEMEIPRFNGIGYLGNSRLQFWLCEQECGNTGGRTPVVLDVTGTFANGVSSDV